MAPRTGASFANVSLTHGTQARLAACIVVARLVVRDVEICEAWNFPLGPSRILVVTSRLYVGNAYCAWTVRRDLGIVGLRSEILHLFYSKGSEVISS